MGKINKIFWTEERINHAKTTYAALLYGHARISISGDVATGTVQDHETILSILDIINTYITDDKKVWIKKENNTQENEQ